MVRGVTGLLLTVLPGTPSITPAWREIAHNFFVRDDIFDRFTALTLI